MPSGGRRIAPDLARASEKPQAIDPRRAIDLRVYDQALGVESDPTPADKTGTWPNRSTSRSLHIREVVTVGH
jgi:hypothetical protein